MAHRMRAEARPAPESARASSSTKQLATSGAAKAVHSGDVSSATGEAAPSGAAASSPLAGPLTTPAVVGSPPALARVIAAVISHTHSNASSDSGVEAASAPPQQPDEEAPLPAPPPQQLLPLLLPPAAGVDPWEQPLPPSSGAAPLPGR